MEPLATEGTRPHYGTSRAALNLQSMLPFILTGVTSPSSEARAVNMTSKLKFWVYNCMFWNLYCAFRCFRFNHFDFLKIRCCFAKSMLVYVQSIHVLKTTCTVGYECCSWTLQYSFSVNRLPPDTADHFQVLNRLFKVICDSQYRWF